jgi:hypothetical protein
MKLIDADKLKEAINSSLNTGRETFSPEIIREAIDEQPTAFDVEKVTESLMNRFRIVSNDEDLEWNRAIDYAIKILEGGGVK